MCRRHVRLSDGLDASVAEKELLLRRAARNRELEPTCETVRGLTLKPDQAPGAKLRGELLRDKPPVRWPPADGQPSAARAPNCWRDAAVKDGTAVCME